MKFDVDKVQYDFINKWFFYPDTIEGQIIVQELVVENAVGNLKAIQSLKGKVERKYEKDNGKLAEVMGMPVKKNQCQEQSQQQTQREEPAKLIQDNHLLFHERQQDLRTKALELALNFLGINKAAYSLGEPQVISTEVHIATAQRFYKYITKGGVIPV